ncbi:MAG TPA: hypothetical protein VFA45_16810 [Actinomycetes bacterium]|jgi:hypothetical protein|nr:hypothetical protein [Actinomycetes bacterium]
MAVPVMIGLLVGLVVGGAAMALWAAGRIGEEAARQFDRGFERGRWLADLSVTRALEPPQRSPRVHLVSRSGLGPGGAEADPPASVLLLPHAEVVLPDAELARANRK